MKCSHSECDIPKCLLIGSNTSLLILALFKISLSAALLNVNNQIDSRLASHCVFGVVNGSILVFLSFIGFYGMLKPRASLLKLFLFGASIIAILHIMLAIMAFATACHMDDKKTKLAIVKLFETYEKNEVYTQVDLIQSEMHCCGLEGPQSWKDEIPSSCCKGDERCTAEKAYPAGCKDSLIASYTKYKFVLAIVAAVTAVVACLVTAITYLAKRSALRLRQGSAVN